MMTMIEYTEAMQLNGRKLHLFHGWILKEGLEYVAPYGKTFYTTFFPNNKGLKILESSDWLIKDVKGNFHGADNDDFKAGFVKVSEKPELPLEV